MDDIKDAKGGSAADSGGTSGGTSGGKSVGGKSVKGFDLRIGAMVLLGAYLAWLLIANREDVRFHFIPFMDGFSLPGFMWLILFFTLGVVMSGLTRGAFKRLIKRD